MPSTHTDNKANPTLLAFTPRQVLLGSQTMKQRSDDNGSSNGTGLLKLEQQVLLHQSIAHYLERSGFSKTLKKFRSEAQIEKDNLDGTLVDLEEMCLKYLEICKDVKANNNNQKEQGKHSKKDREDNLIADMENASKKKKKKIDKSDSDAVDHQSGTEENFKGSSKNSVEMTNGTGRESKLVSKEKDTEKKCKEKKKKKSTLASESLSNGVEGNQFESPPMVTEVKLKDDASAAAKTVNGETGKRSKDKKKKRDKPSSDGDAEELQIGDPNGTDSKKDNFKTSNEDVTDKKKDSKKRKRYNSDEIDVLPADGKADEESKRRKIKNLNESERGELSAKMNGNLKSDSNSNKENIGDWESVQGSDQLKKTSAEQFNGKVNGDLENTGEKSFIWGSQKKQQKGSVEQKAVKAFQRVKAGDVVFADERLQDNSYWAKDGAESGYGAKAEEILSQVRGRDFRHEKTKKKRGTYRGGQIDLQSHSIKFNYSDDE